MHNYKEIQELQYLTDNFDITIDVYENKYLGGDLDYVAVTIRFGSKSFDLFVMDEYEDFKLENPLLSLALVLLELENYMDEDDYLTWCNLSDLNPANVQVRDYYMDLRIIYAEIEKILGVIESPISQLDFELNAGAAQILRQSEGKSNDNHK